MQDKVLKQVKGVRVQFGGVEHSGWLPSGAATPLPTPVENVILDVEIVANGETDCLLCWQSQVGYHSGDTWHRSLAEAERAAEEWFGIKSQDWQS